MSADVTWAGYWPASPTVFGSDRSLDEKGNLELFAAYRTMGVHGALINGSTGEWFSQSNAERKRVTELAVEAIDGAFPIVIGATSFTPQETIDIGNHAAKAGAQGIMVTPPPYVAPTEDEIVEFYREVAGEVAIPTMAYNWPRGADIDMSTELQERITALPGVVSVKDSTPDYGKHLDTLRTQGKNSRYFANYISRLGIGVLNELGGIGSIDGGPLGAAFGVPFYNAYWEGDLETARTYADKYDALLRDLVGYNFAGHFGSQVPQIKAALRMMGLPGGYPRKPFQEITPDAEARLSETLKKHKLL